MDNRSHILNQALTLFAERGYDAVGVQDIATSSGITKPTLYHYFGSKRGLFEALLSEHGRPLMEQVTRAAEYHGDLPYTLFKVTWALFSFGRSHQLFCRIYFSTWFALPGNEAHTITRPFHGAISNTIESLFRAAAHNHGNMRGHEQTIAATFLGTTYTYIALMLNNQIELSEDVARRAVRQFSYGIYT